MLTDVPSIFSVKLIPVSESIVLSAISDKAPYSKPWDFNDLRKFESLAVMFNTTVGIILAKRTPSSWSSFLAKTFSYMSLTNSSILNVASGLFAALFKTADRCLYSFRYTE